jgi:indole-3-glycerol phosphate synthase
MSGRLAEFVTAALARAQALPALTGVAPASRDFAAAVRGRDRVRLIAEFKRRSPSQGALALAGDPRAHAAAAAAAGAAALSVLTEPQWFGGSFADLQQAAAASPLPVLGKDFIVDARQVVAARAAGADAVLLIARCLSAAQVRELAAAAAELAMAVLLECHDEGEVAAALALPAALIGVNNRDLDSLQVDRTLAPRLLAAVPQDRIAVAESGYRNADDVRALLGRCDAVLVGTSLMRGVTAASLVEAGKP